MNPKSLGPDWWQLVLIILGVAFTIGGSAQMLQANAADYHDLSKRVDGIESQRADDQAQWAAISQAQKDTKATLDHIQAQVDYLAQKERER